MTKLDNELKRSGMIIVFLLTFWVFMGDCWNVTWAVSNVSAYDWMMFGMGWTVLPLYNITTSDSFNLPHTRNRATPVSLHIYLMGELGGGGGIHY